MSINETLVREICESLGLTMSEHEDGDYCYCSMNLYGTYCENKMIDIPTFGTIWVAHRYISIFGYCITLMYFTLALVSIIKLKKLQLRNAYILGTVFLFICLFFVLQIGDPYGFNNKWPFGLTFVLFFVGYGIILSGIMMSMGIWFQILTKNEIVQSNSWNRAYTFSAVFSFLFLAMIVGFALIAVLTPAGFTIASVPVSMMILFLMVVVGAIIYKMNKRVGNMSYSFSKLKLVMRLTLSMVISYMTIQTVGITVSLIFVTGRENLQLSNILVSCSVMLFRMLDNVLAMTLLLMVSDRPKELIRALQGKTVGTVSKSNVNKNGINISTNK
eukprot:TRINITY_DN9069_c0_g1_i1.p1 TRINITY_DN9069_c0_g1~~TRINITY_DN9069_c0_g1_i1.p1  ORF type:complete len:330 (-),score=23.39 TRINITY_DN9069_c0_g1_i1:48-1037(-)